MTISSKEGIVKQYDYYSSNTSITSNNLENYNIITKNNFAYNKSYSKGAPWGAIRIMPLREGLLSSAYFTFKITDHELITYYKYFFISSYWHKYIMKISQEGARNHGMLNMSKDDFFKLPVLTYEKHKSIQIANLLSSIDILITKQEECLNTIIKKKDYYYGNIINSGVKFKNIDGKWTSRKIGDIFYNYNGVSLESEVSNEGKYKFISIGNYSSNGKYLDDNKRVLKNKKTSSKILNKDNLVMVLNDKTSNGIIIGSTILIEDDDKYIYNQRSEKLICKNEITPLFAWYFLNSKKVKNNIISLAQGATQIYFNFSSFKKSSFFIPKKEEQTKITNLLSSMDNLINMLVLIY